MVSMKIMKTNSNPVLTLFTQPTALQQVGYARLVKFLGLFSEEFSSKLRSLLTALTERREVTTYREILESPPPGDLILLAATLAEPDLLPERLRPAMYT